MKWGMYSFLACFSGLRLEEDMVVAAVGLSAGGGGVEGAGRSLVGGSSVEVRLEACRRAWRQGPQSEVKANDHPVFLDNPSPQGLQGGASRNSWSVCVSRAACGQHQLIVHIAEKSTSFRYSPFSTVVGPESRVPNKEKKRKEKKMRGLPHLDLTQNIKT